MGALTLLITGAAGYVGRGAVARARAQGHDVIAVVRAAGTVPESWTDDPAITVLECDLTEGTGLAEACAKADVVLHLAASMSGDPDRQARDTLQATETLLRALPRGAKVVHLSSIAVYDMQQVTAGDMITEKAEVLTETSCADAYALAKAAQERLLLEVSELKLTILRAGAVFGPGRLWNAHLGVAPGPILFRLATRGQIPLCHISTCSDALIAAAERRATGPINVLDEDLPDRKRYLNCLKRKPPLTMPLSWRGLMPLAWLATRIAPRDRLPGLLRPEVLRARFLALGYDNSRMREVLGLRQAQNFEALMHEAQT
ncbi:MULTISPECIES: NAD-dependent epimerase/dehydratase family protein [unclassified Marinovum]